MRNEKRGKSGVGMCWGATGHEGRGNLAGLCRLGTRDCRGRLGSLLRKSRRPEKNTPLDPPSRGDNSDFLNLRVALARWGLWLAMTDREGCDFGRFRLRGWSSGWCVARTLALLFVLLMAWPAAGVTFYVAPDGSDAWSGMLAKEDGAGSDGPFATLERAQEAVRAEVAAGLEEDVKVRIRGGTYYVPAGLSFGIEDSGNGEHRVVYAGFQRERAFLVGGILLTAWERYEGEIWVADIPEGVVPGQVFENGRRMTLARTPNEGYLRLQEPVEGWEHVQFVYREGELHPKNWDVAEARVLIWPKHNWSSNELPIARIYPKERTVTLGKPTGYPITPDNRFFVCNVLEELDCPGEACIRLEEGKVYCWPRDGAIAEQEIVVSTAENVVRVSGKAPGWYVQGLELRNLHLGIANGHAVVLSGVKDCGLIACLVENGGEDGVAVLGHAEGVKIAANDIRYHGRNGVLLRGLEPGEPDVNKGHLAEYNHIHHCGRLVGHGAGVYVSQSGHNKILRNEIHHMPRYGTTIKGVRFQVLRERPLAVSWATHWDFLHSRNNLFAYNHIHHVNLDSQDTGAMESWGPGRDNVYDHNVIHDVGNDAFTLQSGMYLDDATDYFSITNNVIYNVRGAGGDQCIYVKGIGNRIENNILVVAPGNMSAIRSFFMAEERCDRHIYRRNIIYFEGSGGALYDFNNWSDDRVAEADGNLFWKAEGTYQVKKAGKMLGLDAWRGVLDGRFDGNSVMANPLFMDAAGHDYRLKPESPAFGLGFVPVLVGEAGVPGELLKHLGRE